jgi:AcrR family transcriptional regulator
MPVSLTAQKIAIAARRLLDREGVEAVTIRRVANAVGITPMAVYRHYLDRAGLLNALANRGFEELASRLATKRSSADIEGRLTKMADIYLEHALENPRLFELMFLQPREGARRFPRDFRLGNSPTASLLEEVIREGMESGHLRKDDTWEIVFEMGALSHGLITLYLGGRIGVSPARFRDFYRRSFRRYIRGIRS